MNTTEESVMQILKHHYNIQNEASNLKKNNNNGIYNYDSCTSNLANVYTTCRYCHFLFAKIDVILYVNSRIYKSRDFF